MIARVTRVSGPCRLDEHSSSPRSVPCPLRSRWPSRRLHTGDRYPSRYRSSGNLRSAPGPLSGAAVPDRQKRVGIPEQRLHELGIWLGGGGKGRDGRRVAENGVDSPCFFGRGVWLKVRAGIRKDDRVGNRQISECLRNEEVGPESGGAAAQRGAKDGKHLSDHGPNRFRVSERAMTGPGQDSGSFRVGRGGGFRHGIGPRPR